MKKIETEETPKGEDEIKFEHGGKRVNSGRHKGEPTKTISYRVKIRNLEKIKEATKIVVNMLDV